MTGTRPAEILRQLEPDPTADRELLQRFLRGDEAAFATLVRRHGPMVLAVCRRIANHVQDAEDAFQAAFLILAKKAAAIRTPELLGNWMYGVAVRVARKARRTAARRRAREVQVVDVPEPFVLPSEPPSEFGPMVHEELAQLPAWYRDALILCDLRGVSRSEAAKVLGIPEGTLSSRLAGGRKKLAERLARRGVTLSVPAASALLVEGTLSAAVPDSLVARTCDVVSGWRAGASLPTNILHLSQGSFTMRPTILLGFFATILTAAGVVLGARPDGPSKAEDPPAVKAESAPEPKAELEAEEFTTQPKLRKAVDLPIRNVRNAIWSPDGKRLAISGIGGPQAGEDHGKHLVKILSAFSDKDAPRQTIVLPATGGSLVGFTTDGKQIITDLRESGLVSGIHRLEFWYAAAVPALSVGPMGSGSGRMGPTTSFVSDRTVDLDSEQTHGYAFAADGKSYRTLAWTVTSDRQFAEIQVREVSTQTGAMKIVLKLNSDYAAVTLSDDGRRLLAAKAGGEVVAFEVEGGKKLWAATPDLGSAPGSLGAGPVHISAPADGKLGFVARGVGRPILLNGDTGRFSLLEGADLVRPESCTYSADGRLLAATGRRYGKKEVVAGFGPGGPPPMGGPPMQTSISPAGEFLNVWDTRTGKLVKSWPANFPVVAFHPTKPILAVLEHNGQNQTRLGLWDFAAEVPAKK